MKRFNNILWKAYLLIIKLKNRTIFNELTHIAIILEEEMFPKLQTKGIMEITINLTNEGIKIEGYDSIIPVSDELQVFFKSLGITRIKTDTIMEYNQLIDILTDIYGLNSFLEKGYSYGFDPLGIKERIKLLSEDGYKGYCAVTRLLPEKCTLLIKYEYCELNFSKATKNLKNKSKFRDHRVFFKNASRYGIVCGIAFTIIGLITLYVPSYISVAIFILMGIIISIAVFLIFQTIGSLEYDKEHLMKKLKEKGGNGERKE
ncbi:MAG: hypothetical protein HY096_08480 [Nitrospinae bacterium]|nr:hypothetical protein [Nitrospinota bacterium]